MFESLVLIELWLIGVNFHIISNAGIDVSAVFQMHSENLNASKSNLELSKSSKSPKLIHYDIYKIAFIFTSVFVLFHSFLYSFDIELLFGVHICVIFIFLYFILDVFFRGIRKRFFRCIWRIIFPSLNNQIDFGDIVVADILTSFSRLFSITSYSLCTSIHEDGNCLLFSYLLSGLPYIWRLRQCISDHIFIRTKSSERGNNVQLYNALKYLSIWPLIFSSYYHNLYGSSYAKVWIFSSLVNCLFSLYWDIYHDWDLGYINDKNSPFFLRQRLTFNRSHIFKGITSFFVNNRDFGKVGFSTPGNLEWIFFARTNF
jgi:hypothetical protein